MFFDMIPDFIFRRQSILTTCDCSFSMVFILSYERIKFIFPPGIKSCDPSESKLRPFISINQTEYIYICIDKIYVYEFSAIGIYPGC